MKKNGPYDHYVVCWVTLMLIAGSDRRIEIFVNVREACWSLALIDSIFCFKCKVTVQGQYLDILRIIQFLCAYFWGEGEVMN